MQEFISYGLKKGADFVEIKSSESENNVVDVTNQEVSELSNKSTQLYSVRILNNGSFGMAYSNKPEFKILVDNALKSAKKVDHKIDVNNIPQYKRTVDVKLIVNPLDVDLEEKKKLLFDLNKHNQKNINSLRNVYRDTVTNYSIVNSEGTDVNLNDSNVAFVSWAFAKSGDRQENTVEIIREHGGFEVMDKAKSKVDESLKIAQKLLKAKFAKGGNFPVIADQYLGGVFTHEAVGHATEADIVLRNDSVLKGKMNKIIGNENVTILDSGAIEGLNGWVPFDDDGVKASPTTLIKNGELVSYLHSLETASVFGVKPTGNGRSQSIAYQVIPRMTTTYINKGNSNFNEMLSSIKDGYYLKGSMGGQVETSLGEFLFSAKYGYKIENGELKHMVKAASLIGNILDILPKISLVGKDLKFGTGTCGKCGQGVPVSDGSPHIKIDKAKVGGQN